MNFKRFFLATTFSVAYTISFAALYTPTEADAKNANVKLEDLMQGRELYKTHCGSCHALHLPSEFTKDKWVKVLNKMQKPGKITDEQKQIILNFINTNAK